MKYLDTLKADKLKLTRTFSGAYVEPDNASGIARNTLAPRRDALSAPGRAALSPGMPTAATSSISTAGTIST
jgi:hypothetical protein